MRIEEFDPETMERFTLPRDAKAMPEQIEMVREAKKRTPVYDEDCPPPSEESLERMRKYAEERNRRRAKFTIKGRGI